MSLNPAPKDTNSIRIELDPDRNDWSFSTQPKVEEIKSSPFGCVFYGLRWTRLNPAKAELSLSFGMRGTDCAVSIVEQVQIENRRIGRDCYRDFGGGGINRLGQPVVQRWNRILVSSRPKQFSFVFRSSHQQQ
jgi:hypothetical protein